METRTLNLCLLTEYSEFIADDYLASLLDAFPSASSLIIFSARDGFQPNLGEKSRNAITVSQSLEEFEFKQFDQLCDCDWVVLIPPAAQLHVLNEQRVFQCLARDNIGGGTVVVQDDLGMAQEQLLFKRADHLSSVVDFAWKSQDECLVQVPHRFMSVSLNPSVLKDRAASVITRQFEQGPSFLTLAMAWETLGDHENALSHYQHALAGSLESTRHQWLAYYRAALILIQQHNFDLANTLLDRAMKIWPTRIEPVVQKAKLLREKDEPDNALALLKQVESQTLQDAEFPHHYQDYVTNRFVERALCENSLGLHHEVVVTVNKLSESTAHHLIDKSILEMRDEAYIRWRKSSTDTLAVNSDRDNRFVVITAFRNAGEFLQQCIDSVASQTYRNYHMMLIDDASDDGAVEQADFSGLASFELVQNKSPKCALENQITNILTKTTYDDILVFLDGDDWLAHEAVLSKLNELYQRTDCWVSYGQASWSNSGQLGYARPLIGDISASQLFTSKPIMFPIHLRTHRAGVLHCLSHQDPDLTCFKDEQGDYLKYASDIAHMRAVFMLAGLHRCEYVPEVLYIYNTENPLSHFRSRTSRLHQNSVQISQMQDLSELSSYDPAAI